MAVLAPNTQARRSASGSALARRSFLERCLGVVVGGMTMQGAPALAQTAMTSPMDFFPGFRRQTIQTSGTTINVIVGGDGPPVLLLHGYPQTHVAWLRIAEADFDSIISALPDDFDADRRSVLKAIAAAKTA
jgi:pimeloyl-ACP methyl ester carboxylesterase